MEFAALNKTDGTHTISVLEPKKPEGRKLDWPLGTKLGAAPKVLIDLLNFQATHDRDLTRVARDKEQSCKYNVQLPLGEEP